MQSTALGVKNLFNSVQVDNLVVNETISTQSIQSQGTTNVNSAVVATLLEPATTLTVDIGSPSHRFKRAYLDDVDVGASRPHKYLKTDAVGVVQYVDVNFHDPITIGTSNGLSLSGSSGQVLNMALASNNDAGALSAPGFIKLNQVGVSVSGANGLTSNYNVADAQVLTLSTATTSSGGAMSASDKVVLDKLNTDLLGTTVNLGVTTSPVTNTINIGTGSGPTTLNLGGPGDTVNIQGTLVAVDTQNAQVTDAVLTLNKNGVNANSVGLQILGADPAVAAEIKTNGTGSTLQIQGVTGVDQVEIGGVLVVDQSAQTVSVNHNSNAASADLRVKNASTGDAAGSVVELSVHNDAATITKYGAAHASNASLLSIVNGSGTLNMNTTGVTSGTCDLVSLKHPPVSLTNGTFPVSAINGLEMINDQELFMAVATTTSAGAMTGIDKEKLSHISSSVDGFGFQRTIIDGVLEVQTNTDGTYPQVKFGSSGGVGNVGIYSSSISSTPLTIYASTGQTALEISNNGIVTAGSGGFNVKSTNTMGPDAPVFTALNTIGTTVFSVAEDGETSGICDLVTLKHNPVTLTNGSDTVTAINGLSIDGQKLFMSVASSSTPGSMSTTDKIDLDAVVAGTHPVVAPATIQYGRTGDFDATWTGYYVISNSSPSNWLSYTPKNITCSADGYLTFAYTGVYQVTVSYRNSTPTSDVWSTCLMVKNGTAGPIPTGVEVVGEGVYSGRLSTYPGLYTTTFLAYVNTANSPIYRVCLWNLTSGRLVVQAAGGASLSPSIGVYVCRVGFL